MKEVYYSYLLNREKSLKKALSLFGETTEVAVLHKTKAAAIRARDVDCEDHDKKPGPLVKITLELDRDAK